MKHVVRAGRHDKKSNSSTPLSISLMGEVSNIGWFANLAGAARLEILFVVDFDLDFGFALEVVLDLETGPVTIDFAAFFESELFLRGVDGGVDGCGSECSRLASDSDDLLKGIECRRQVIRVGWQDIRRVLRFPPCVRRRFSLYLVCVFSFDSRGGDLGARA